MTVALEVFFDQGGRRCGSRAGGQARAGRHLEPRHDLAPAAQPPRFACRSTTVRHRRFRARAIRGLLGSELTFEVVGVFPGEQTALLLGATVTTELLRAHAAVHTGIGRDSEGIWELYQPGRWSVD